MGSQPSEPPVLTFDDGPAEDTKELLDVLGRYGVTATFFVLGSRVVANPSLVERMAQEGHQLGNHSWDHPNLRELPLGDVHVQLARTSGVIEQVAETRPTLFRPPWGYASAEIEAIAADLGMRTMLWDVDTGDYALPGVEAIRSRIVSAPSGSVVLLHDGHADGEHDRKQTVAAVAQALADGVWPTTERSVS